MDTVLRAGANHLDPRWAAVQKVLQVRMPNPSRVKTQPRWGSVSPADYDWLSQLKSEQPPGIIPKMRMLLWSLLVDIQVSH